MNKYAILFFCAFKISVGSEIDSISTGNKRSRCRYELNTQSKKNATDSEVSFQRGLLHFRGNYVEKDYKKAFDFFLKAATQGHAEAQHNLGFCYLDAIGVKKNVKEALKWFFKAAIEQGHAEAQYTLGLLYCKRLFVLEDQEKCAEWIFRAAQNKLPEALEFLKYNKINHEYWICNPNTINTAVHSNATASASAQSPNFTVKDLYEKFIPQDGFDNQADPKWYLKNVKQLKSIITNINYQKIYWSTCKLICEGPETDENHIVIENLNYHIKPEKYISEIDIIDLSGKVQSVTLEFYPINKEMEVAKEFYPINKEMEVATILLDLKNKT